jgi:hypothetical protein
VFEKDGNMDGLFARLERDSLSYTGITKLLSETLLNHKESILKRKRLPAPDMTWDGQYFQDLVLPLVFTHLVMYKPNELVRNALPEQSENDKGLVANFLNVLHKQTNAIVYQIWSR